MVQWYKDKNNWNFSSYPFSSYTFWNDTRNPVKGDWIYEVCLPTERNQEISGADISKALGDGHVRVLRIEKHLFIFSRLSRSRWIWRAFSAAQLEWKIDQSFGAVYRIIRTLDGGHNVSLNLLVELVPCLFFYLIPPFLPKAPSPYDDLALTLKTDSDSDDLTLAFGISFHAKPHTTAAKLT